MHIVIISDPQHIECSNLTKARWAYTHDILHTCNHELKKRMCPPGCHHNSFAATHGNSCTGAQQSSCAQGNELPQSNCGDNLEGTLFSWWLHNFKFTSKYSGEWIGFSDIETNKEDNRLLADVFVKSTDTHQHN